jgi:DNA mismatch endonuclease (patch repair protein)
VTGAMAERWRAPFASSEATRRRMQAQPRRDTAPELALRRELHRAGLRYRVDVAPLSGLRRRADIVFARARVAVFVDGCFWHGCDRHGRREHQVNAWYWPEKIDRNRRRDADTDRRLGEAGWTVLRVWEHEAPAEAAQRVVGAVHAGQRREPAS